MSVTEIFYVKNQSISKSLVREIDVEKQSDQKYNYHKCPVWNHKAKRTFIVVSPVDYSFSVDVKNQNIIHHDDSFDNPDETNKMFLMPDDLISPHPTVQITIPSYIFWCKQPNVWIEYRDHPLTSVKNNFVAVGGWFSLSTHPRDGSLGMKIFDETKPVIVKKNDPVYKLCFHPVDLTNEIELVESDSVPSEIADLFHLNQEKKFKRDPSFFTEVLFPSR